MSELVPSKIEVEEKYVARYEDVKPSSAFFLDTALPEFERQVKNVIGAAAGEDPTTSPAITAATGSIGGWEIAASTLADAVVTASSSFSSTTENPKSKSSKLISVLFANFFLLIPKVF